MKAGNIIACCIILLGLGSVTPVWSASSKVEFSGHAAEMQTYDFVEVEIHVANPDATNPFTNMSVQTRFGSEGATPVQVDGFCDSPDGSAFRIHFMPTRAGRYEYTIQYKHKGLDRAQQDPFIAVTAGRKGLLRVDPENRWHFLWEGTGEHCFLNGTTTYYLMGWADETIRQSRSSSP